MNPDVLHAIDSILTTPVMMLIWLVVIFMSIYISCIFKMWGVLVLAGGAMPNVIFYIYKYFHVWETSYEAVLYSRLASVSLAVSIILSLWLMYRSRYGLDKLPPV